MKLHIPLVALAALMAPALVFAQSSGGGRGEGPGQRGKGVGTVDPMAVTETAIQAQLVNSVNLLIAHNRELALTREQLVQIVAVKRSLDSANVPLTHRLDSLRVVLRTAARNRSLWTDKTDPQTETHAVVDRTVEAIRENIIPAEDRAHALLTSAQLEKAMEIENRAHQDANEAAKAAAERARAASSG